MHDVLIVGGGVGGMGLATLLARQGCKVVLAERDPAWRAVGAGLTLNSATLRAFDRIGVLQRIREEGHCHSGGRVYDGGGALLFETRPGQSSAAPSPMSGGILRPALHSILAEATRAAGVDVRLGVSVGALEETRDQVDVTLSDGSQNVFDMVVGADGIGSSIRAMIFPNAPKPAFTGQGCWRAVLNRPRQVDTAIMFWGRDHKAGLNPVSDTQMYMYVLQHVPENNWMPPEVWPDLMRAELAEFGGLMAEVREELDATSQINYRPLEALLLAPPWHRGRVGLIGDAVHATTPHSAYGSGLAAEDAVVMAELVGEGLEPPALFERFVERRYERCRAVVEGSVLLGKLEMERAPVIRHREAAAMIQRVVAEPI